jgi:hypothetical protein
MQYSFTSNTTMWLNGMIVFGTPQAPPSCTHCRTAPATKQLQDGVLICDPCLEVLNRKLAIQQAPAWLNAAFRACTREQRSKLYRQLSIVFHPDAGGDEELMKALNAVKEQFP